MIKVQPELKSEMIQYPGYQGTHIDAYLSLPAASGRYPGVIVIMEAFGLVEHDKDIARRFAAEGYVAIAPDLYTREGTPEPNMDAIMKTMFGQKDSQSIGDLVAAATYLKSQPESNGKVGAIGFCSGGRQTLMLACQNDVLDAAVDSAGGFIIHDATPERPVQPIDMVSNLSCPLMGTFGLEDGNPNPEHAKLLEAELEKHGKTYELYMYSNAGHAFFADYRDSFRPGPAADMWHRVVLFYEKYLKG